MAQYTPMPNTERFPELQKTVSAETNDALVEYMTMRGMKRLLAGAVLGNR